MADTKKGFVPKTFSDAGTGKTFACGKEYDFDAGTHANYLAAGLIGDAPVKEAGSASISSAATTKAKA